MIKHFVPRPIRYAIALALLVLVAGPGSVSRAGDEEYSAVMAWGRLGMYERGSNGKLMHRSFEPETKAWSDWEPLTDERITSSPSALMTDGGTRLAVFFRGTDGKLYHLFRDQESEWSRVIGLGDREMRSGPSAVIAGEVLTVFARSTHGTLMKIYYDKARSSWTDWSDVE